MVDRLSKYEQETIINFNREEDKAYIFTYEKAWQRQLERRLGAKPIMDNGMGGKEYLVDKERVRMPQPKRRYSNEVRKKKVEQLNKARSVVKIDSSTQRK